ncbi:Transcription factor, fork head [Kalmanozyma brasiliensis GHG001]|uniref:Fork-head domain-containing protein n=1 Tax=Kalmanozyma brasiliensis (strain GHG001) TaxID=1365824 RepID=V5E6A7_KALBG|nr:Transcription factor, fork head [Kalmanozyma brasiliensis GHG001]EST05796.1 Transcription factor, fork head [Kalmanozyma brasiliensis GHG001]
MNATMASYQGSGANSPALGRGVNNQYPHNIVGTSLTAPASPSGAYTASALAYANAQLSQYAATGGTAALPAHLHPHALSSALSDYSISLPNSAASSPGATPRRLPGTGTSTPGGNSRVAASAITGKRLNWSEMICQTIAESESGRLVIQDLFEGMCSKFPEIREWAFGKDWEARVKNRIKSTLSIKGNLFVKVPRPSSAAGKGSWWTLSPEAQEAWKTGRVANVVKNNAHSRAGSAGPSSIHGSPVRTVSSKFGTSSHTTNPPYLVQNSHAHQNHSQRTSPLGIGLAQAAHSYGSPLANNFNFGESLPMVGALSQNSALPSNLGLGGDDTNLSLGGQQPNTQSMQDQAQNAQASMATQSFANLAFLQPNGPQPLGNAQSVPHLGGPQSMPFPAQGQDLSAANLASFANFGNNDYSAIFAGIPGFDANAFAAANSTNNGQVNMGMGAYQMEQSSHPFGGSIPGAYTLLQQQQQQQQQGAGQQGQPGQPSNNAYPNFGSNLYANLQQGNQMSGQQQRGLNQNPGTSSQQTPQSQSQSQQSASQRATPQPQPSQPSNSNTTSGMASGYSGSFPASSPFPGNGLEGPSPADSTWFSFTPLVQPTNDANDGGSALGQLGGEGSRKRRTSGADLGDFQLPPPQDGA